MKIHKYKDVIFSVIVLSISGLIVTTCNEKIINNRIEYLMKENFAIGIFEGRTYYSDRRVKGVLYEYYIGKKKYFTADVNAYKDSEKALNAFSGPHEAKKGDQFLVFYKAEDPKRSIIRLDYPIKDSTDFKRYVKEIEELRKNELNK